MSNITYLLVRGPEGFTLDLSQAGIAAADLATLKPRVAAAHEEMCAIERGDIKNPDENRRVTHFTDRQAYADGGIFADVEGFFEDLRQGRITGSTGTPLDALVVNGIGGSALGPQLLQHALRGPYWNELDREQRQGNLRIYFTDNTDAAGLNDVAAVVNLERTLMLAVSKSGGTRETRNNTAAMQSLYAARGLDFTRHAAAVTMPGSLLDQAASADNWLKVWPMAESIGGRTSETAIVGHVPAAAAGLDFRALLAGALTMDEWTRAPTLEENPAYLLAAVWHILGNGRGERNMVIVPYSDRLVLLSRYLQQLVMESLGKELDRDGAIVEQGLTVFGNKGGTDAHAYIQQLHDGRNDFFVTFIEILRDAANLMADDRLSMGDYLHNFLQGLSKSLAAKGRSVVNISLESLNERSLGMIIALYERAVAVYAELININAFNQPGVSAYKNASAKIDELALLLQDFIAGNRGFDGGASDFAASLGRGDQSREVGGILAKFTLNRRQFGEVSVTRALDESGRWRYRIA